MEWEWKIGVLNGIGVAVWEQKENSFKKITALVVTQNGVVFIKSPLGLVMPQVEEWEAEGVVLMSAPASEGVIGQVRPLWGGKIIPANGFIPRILPGGA